MTDYKISQLTTVTAPPAGALVPIVDVTDTTTVPAGPGGSNKAILAGNLSLSKMAGTAVGGYALVNGTGTIISWLAPNDGALHRVLLMANMDVTVAETGGATAVSLTLPDGTVVSSFAGIGASQGTGLHTFLGMFFVKANTTITFTQSTALTAGTSVLWAEFWGS